jgi:hypothetical protein
VLLPDGISDPAGRGIMFSKKAGMSYFFIKIKPSHTIVSHNVISQFVSYGGSPTAINATLAIIANGGRAIVVN